MATPVPHHRRYVTGQLHDTGLDQHYRSPMPVEQAVAKRLGDLISSARDDLGWTQDDLARESGVSRPTIQRYENGKSREPELEKLLRIFVALRINVLELPVAFGLLTREEAELPPPSVRPRYSAETEEIIGMLEDPSVSDEEKQALAALLAVQRRHREEAASRARREAV